MHDVAVVDVGEAPRRRRGLLSRGALVIALGWVVAAVMLQLLRQEGAPAVDTVWGEDGSLFLSQAVRDGLLAPVLDPYSGYLHVISRLGAGLISLLPLRATAVAFAVIPALTVSVLSVYVFVVSREVVQTTVARAALAVLVVVPPPGGYETTATFTSLQWNLLVPCFLAITVRPRSRSHATMSAVIVGLTALSAPISLVLVPLSIWRLVRGPRERDRVVNTTFLSGAAVQILFSLAAEGLPSHGTHLLDLPLLLALRVGTGTVLGPRLLGELWPSLSWGLAVAGAALLGGAAIVCFRARDREGSLLLQAIGVSAAMFAVPVYMRGSALLFPIGDELTLNGARWEVGPVVLFAMVLVALAERAWRAGTRASLAVTLIIGLALVTATITSFRSENPRSSGPRWSHAMDAAAELCATRREVRVPISPRPWVSRLPCERVVPAVDERGGGGVPPPVG